MAEIAVDNLKGAANCFKLLSLCYYQPGEALEETIIALNEECKKIYPEALAIIEKIEEELTKFKADTNYLLVDYAKLFVGPFDVLAPPYGSVYLDNDRRVMGESTAFACQFYTSVGLEIDNGFKEAPDHIAVELEFVYYLIFKYLATKEEDYLNTKDAFLNTHLGLWYEQFTKNIMEKAETNFYQQLALLTKGFINKQLDKS